MGFAALSALPSVFAALTRISSRNSVSNGTRSPFPLKDGWVSITTGHPKSCFTVVVSFEISPSTFAEFYKTTNGTDIPALHPFTNLCTKDSLCIPVNVADTGLPEAKNGTNATSLQFNSGDGNLFQGADVVLSDSSYLPSDAKCINSAGIFIESSLSSTSTSPASSFTSTRASSSNTSGSTSILAPALLADAAGVTGAVLSLF
ncbi:hypothetical protein M422DRAFT_259099 [Sphaerobolus stellatus SS14]|uniref:Copper acquisition factor BIM1-like domain-containing protein n=1 Tax=Sphaerobolus stellatus (strain SS14) TaxID=990650 RepID=A0A0C9VKW5_SPHS4|nr:hypothetical protein M422DRAFT_259099 [Sphaerobolus stellatus SS14]